MSRIIVKNLPNQITEKKLHDTFSSKGQITDLQLKYTKEGVFRHFGFVGYKTEEEAKAAIEYFNDTFLESSKIKVEVCADLGNPNRPRPWSKYAKGSSANQKILEKQEQQKQKKEDKNSKDGKKKVKSKEKNTKNLIGELEKDSEFIEFLEVHKRGSKKPLWSNDIADFNVYNSAKNLSDEDEIKDNEEEKSEDNKGSEKQTSSSKPSKDTMSPMQFLKTKVVKTTNNDSGLSSDVTSSDDENKDAKLLQKKKKLRKHKKKSKKLKMKENKVTKTDDSEVSSEADDSNEKDENKQASYQKPQEQKNKEKFSQVFDSEYTVKLKNLPYKCKKKQIKQFFSSLKPVSLRIPPKLKGFAYVKFRTEKEMNQALIKHRGFLEGRRIDVIKYVRKDNSNNEERWKKFSSEEGPPVESVAESGRIFARNLSYTATEEDLENLFKKYGPLLEVNLPIDFFTKKIKGFAFITFMFPEHAVKAFSELDGCTFQGRVLHLLPSKEKKTQEDTNDKGTFKKEKLAKEKGTSVSSHNWNTLFLAPNAVADVMAVKYKISKAKLLNTESSQDSLAVRMALVETQLVNEIRDFLTQHHVHLDAFNQPTQERSKTVILAKNLPAKTHPEELKQIFGKFGTISQIILPPSGITAIIEFQEPIEARTAFRKLAYTKFQHVPLYLEWAPINIFSSEASENAKENQENPPEAEEESQENSKGNSDEQMSGESDGEVEPGPNTTLFVKNLNFETTEEALKKHFKKCGKLHSVTVAKKKDLKNPGNLLSMGYGFVQFKQKSSAQAALKELQHSQLDGHAVELKMSNRETQPETQSTRKMTKVSKNPKSTKILVRNIPFEATLKEVKELFAVFGELKGIRLPKKMSGTGSHRGFGFVDFLTRNDAKRAFKALSQSTHLFGRRLVLEWADTDDNTVETLRKKTADQFLEGPQRKRVKLTSIKDSLVGEEGL